MKKIVKIAVLALVLFALVSGGKAYFEQKAIRNIDSDQVVLVDFDNSGDPDYVSLY